MNVTFSRSLRALAADGLRLSWWLMLAGALLFAAWLAWFFFSGITLYEVSETARVEAHAAVYPIEAPVNGQVAVVQMYLGREVDAGDVLVELDMLSLQAQLLEEQAHLAALPNQLAMLLDEVAEIEQTLLRMTEASELLIEEARARYREAEAVARITEDEATRSSTLRETGVLSEAELLRSTVESERRLAAAKGLELAVSRLELDQENQVAEKRTYLQGLRREAARLSEDIEARSARAERLEHEIEKRIIRAPVSGVLGEIEELRAGQVLEEGERIAAVISHGELRIVAEFAPAALARVRPSQSAWLRLDAFPWSQYGRIPATVATVASEPRSGRIRTELELALRPGTSVPMQHGMPGSVEVEVEPVSPAILVLRAAGRLISPASMRGTDSARSGE